MTVWGTTALDAARSACCPRRTGRVSRLVGLRLEVEGIEAAVGDAVRVWRDGGVLDAEVVAVQGSSLACMPMGISAISSRKSVPPVAFAKSPGRAARASVNAPFT